MFVALLAHIVAIGTIFCLRGWRRGLIAIAVSTVAFLISIVAGFAASVTIWELAPLPLLAMLAAGVYVVIVIGWMRWPVDKRTASPR
ncbi:MAG: hypothetical protein JWR89_4416 [Tardiphaga sp.]|uniref:hypothetical protein n=1 Tax=Tardiphaga sp. TaxID=1926292 RepID=UPI002637934A|nr:hypothetical protein [Tardiphaga sp.]MDB5504514.1 hypothetical protein [Tardiphaga sp.]